MYDIKSVGDTFYIAYRSKTNNLPHIGRSLYNGKIWEDFPLSDELKGNPKLLELDPKNSKTMYIGGTKTGSKKESFFFRSLDSGSSWDQLDTEFGPEKREYAPLAGSDQTRIIFGAFDGILSITVDPVHESRIYTGTNEGLYFSDDQGETWDSLYDDACHDIELSKSGIIYAVFQSGIFSSEDDGKNWECIIESDEKYTIRPVFPEYSKIYLDEANDILYTASVHGLIKIEL
ncbi:WD40/YVTN/BNR-like repeat-containing protein [candidate division KSB1 bacterium]